MHPLWIPIIIAAAFVIALLYIQCIDKYLCNELKNKLNNKIIPEGIIICEIDYSDEKPTIIKV